MHALAYFSTDGVDGFYTGIIFPTILYDSKMMIFLALLHFGTSKRNLLYNCMKCTTFIHSRDFLIHLGKKKVVKVENLKVLHTFFQAMESKLECLFICFFQEGRIALY